MYWRSKMSKISEKILNKARKIHALIQSSEENEASVAKAMFDNLCRKYGITEDDIRDEPKIMREIEFSMVGGYERRLASSLVYKILNVNTFSYTHWTNRRTVIGVKMTDKQWTEFQWQYGVFKKGLWEHLDKSVSAYISTNEIWAHDPPDKSSKEWTEDDLKRWEDVSRMASGMKPVAIRKQLAKQG